MRPHRLDREALTVESFDTARPAAPAAITLPQQTYNSCFSDCAACGSYDFPCDTYDFLCRLSQNGTCNTGRLCCV